MIMVVAPHRSPVKTTRVARPTEPEPDVVE
jgi:hypothetical protein